MVAADFNLNTGINWSKYFGFNKILQRKHKFLHNETAVTQYT